MLRLERYLQRKPTALSGGQRQRVAIGRAIVREPRIFLFDEPLSNLDAELRVGMRAELAQLHRRLGTTMIYVTHDQVEAMTMADRIVVLRAGRVEQVGPPLELYNAPANQFVAGFIGSPRMNFFAGQGGACRAGRGRPSMCPASARCARRPPPRRAAWARASRSASGPSMCAWAADVNAFGGSVASVEQLGGLSYVRLAEPDLTVQIAGQTGLGTATARRSRLPVERHPRVRRGQAAPSSGA